MKVIDDEDQGSGIVVAADLIRHFALHTPLRQLSECLFFFEFQHIFVSPLG
jgi:hypothetical protein